MARKNSYIKVSKEKKNEDKKDYNKLTEYIKIKVVLGIKLPSSIFWKQIMTFFP